VVKVGISNSLKSLCWYLMFLHHYNDKQHTSGVDLLTDTQTFPELTSGNRTFPLRPVAKNDLAAAIYQPVCLSILHKFIGAVCCEKRADLNMFRMFGQTGIPTKRGSTRQRMSDGSVISVGHVGLLYGML